MWPSVFTDKFQNGPQNVLMRNEIPQCLWPGFFNPGQVPDLGCQGLLLLLLRFPWRGDEGVQSAEVVASPGGERGVSAFGFVYFKTRPITVSYVHRCF